MKKFISVLLVAVMLFSLSVNVMAQAYSTGITKSVEKTDADTDRINEQNRLQYILTKVKTLIDIPQEYSEFNYSIRTRYDREYWSLQWNNETYDKCISIMADQNGRITSYYHDIVPNVQKAPVITKQKALDIANSFIKKLYPEIMDKLVPEDNSAISSYNSNSYRFGFVRNENGINFASNNVQITVDYVDGRIKSFNINWDPQLQFDSPDDIVSEDFATDKWKSDSAMELTYRIFTDYDNGNYINTVAKLIYTNVNSQRNILAKDGEYLEENYGWAAGDKIFGTMNDSASSEGESMKDVNSSISFTENELKRIQELDNYITVQRADEIVRSFDQLAIDDSFTLSSYSTQYFYMPYTNTQDRPVVWNLTYSGKVTQGDFNPLTAYASVDASTGELLSFTSNRNYQYGYHDNNGDGIFDQFVVPELKIEQKQAQELAHEFLQTAQPDKYNNLKLKSSNKSGIVHYDSAVMGKQDTDQSEQYYTSVSMSFSRMHNDIPVSENNAHVNVDCVEGKITRYSINWTDNLTFDCQQPSIDEKTAIDTYFENSEKILEYILYTVYLYDLESAQTQQKTNDIYVANPEVIQTQDQTRLIYRFYCPFYAVSALSGKPIDYNGNEYQKAEDISFDQFEDIEGHWAEEKINLLRDIGIVLADETFCPDQEITQKEFIAMLMAVSNGYTPILRYSDIDTQLENLMRDMKNRGYYISEKDADISPESPLVRKDAAKFIVRGLGYEKIATLGNIFTTEFLDNDLIDEKYLGYAALANALGIINGSEGCFNGDHNITRAESAVLIYNYMNAER